MHNIEKLIIDWQNIIRNIEGVKRICHDQISAEVNAKPIKIITGFRRSGKSFLTQQIAKESIEKELFKLENILYINFEDAQTLPYQNLKGLELIWNTFKQKISQKGKKLVIFDEIQIIPKWDKFIRSLYEKDKEVSLFLTGSNSKLLSSELGSNLAGRFIEFSIHPFSFKEFITFNHLDIKNKTDFLRKSQKIHELYNEYFNYGGLPEIFSITTPSAKKSYHEGIIKKVILDDIIKRFNIKNISLIEELLSYLLAGIGNITFASKLTNKINSIKKSNVSQNTILEYIQYFLNTFALIPINKFDWKQSLVFETTKKYYSIDIGLIDSISESLVNINTQKLENLVCLHLKQKNKKVFFAQDNLGKEIDFIVPKKKTYDKYQVCSKLTPDNKKRELGNFILADKYLKSGNNFLVSEDESQVIKYKNTKIKIINIIDFLLEL